MVEEKISTFFQNRINKSQIPGAVISISHKNKIIMEMKIGNRMLNPIKAPMAMNTIFDIASMTKVVITLPAILKLVDDKVINLNDSVSSYIPLFGKDGKNNINITHLLTHTSELPSERLR